MPSLPDLDVELPDLYVVHELDLDVEAAVAVDEPEHEAEPVALALGQAIIAAQRE